MNGLWFDFVNPLSRLHVFMSRRMCVFVFMPVCDYSEAWTIRVTRLTMAVVQFVTQKKLTLFPLHTQWNVDNNLNRI